MCKTIEFIATAYENRSPFIYEGEHSLEGKNIMLEEYAKELIVEEETHIGEVEKMLKKFDN